MPIADIVVDLRPDPRRSDFERSLHPLREAGVTALIGDHLDDPDHMHPLAVTEALVDLGVPVVATITCRDRAVEELHELTQSLDAAGATAILCVTGDHPAARFSPSAHATFALDGVRLTSLVRGRGPFVAVAESPASPPLAARAQRLRLKQDAGADLAILNHAGDAASLVRFAERCRDVGVTMPLVAPVAVVTDATSARTLLHFPGVHISGAALASLHTADDPAQSGLDIAVATARELLTGGRFAAVNLSGRATGGGPVERNTIMADLAWRIRESFPSPSPVSPSPT